MHDRVIGFIGYGAMASLMGRNLAKAGYEILAYTPSGEVPSDDKAVSMLTSPREVAEQSDVIILCVPDDKAEKHVLEGRYGLLAGLKAGQLLLDTSTVSPAQADNLASILSGYEVQSLDCPMSGSTPEAEKGDLILLAGGHEADLKRAKPILDIIGRVTIHTGGRGSAARLKLVINGIMGATMSIIGEAVSYGLAAGIKRDTLFNTLQEVAVISPHHKRKLKMAQEKSFSSQFPTRLMVKDMLLLLDSGRNHSASLLGMAIATQAFEHLNEIHKDEDYSALIGQIEAELS
ncbi:NAD-binding protein [Aristophania vespae]|uniref:NAD-binding protein n=1 Tax=Aristophania vespae TaxID=2697033 RepID=A0A6P1NCZ6_9PROT|nr:NAD(P)-dependent oxidoreductase [Aristophania vespae]QHI95329.1 NAD-binding protein [Aristophania vespae]UMM64589.1 2-(hydroxymethyl)glutarate dehydrogenase [Aristophania vespae]